MTPFQFILPMKWSVLLLSLALTTLNVSPVKAGERRTAMIDIQKTIHGLEDHLKMLTVSIGERSVALPANLERTAHYIQSFYGAVNLPAYRREYEYGDLTVANVVAEIAFCPNPSKRYLLGAHYDSVIGTVGADDNASAVAVQLETARHLRELKDREPLDLAVRFVSFALEEPPVYGTRHMGSRVYATEAKKTNERIDGMLCLEMVGYSCHDPGCQRYPFPLMFMGYPKAGNFIGLVGNTGSSTFTKSLFRAFKKNTELPVAKLTVPLRGWPVPAVRLSDHASFWDRGFKAVMITDSSFYRNPHYHLPSDTMDTLDYRFMAELVESLLIFFRSHRR
jgi:Zn-dependent M28 family amino/carboxypeptidase